MHCRAICTGPENIQRFIAKFKGAVILKTCQLKKLVFYILFNSQGHIGTGSQHLSLVGVEQYVMPSAILMRHFIGTVHMIYFCSLFPTKSGKVDKHCQLWEIMNKIRENGGNCSNNC